MIACVVGLGSIGRRYAAILHSLDIEFDVVSSGKGSLTQSVSTQELKNTVGFRRCFKVLDDAIHRDYDFWIIATPSVFHSEQGAQLLKKGQNLFIEKPVAVDYQGIELLRANLEGYNGIAGVAYTLRAHPYVRSLLKLIKESQFGAPISANTIWSSYLPSWHPWENYKVGYVARPEMGGGVTLTCSHEIDLILLLFGNMSNFIANTSSRSHLDISVDDCLDALFIFQSGLNCHLHLDLFQRKSRRTIEVIFDYGYAQIDFNKHSFLVCGDEIRIEALDDNAADVWSTVYRCQVSSYVDAIKGSCEDRLFATLSDGLEAASVCNQIISQSGCYTDG